MSRLKYKELSQVCKLVNGKVATEKVNLDNYISTENMIQDKGGVTVATTIPNSKTVSAYKTNDILTSNIRPYFRKIWFANKEGGCSNDVLVFRVNKGENAKFVYYALSDVNFFNYATVTAKGTKMPRGSKSAIMKYLVPDVNLDTQKKTADILSAYDELIENNNRRIELLENAAQDLYEEWFVRFRFPGYKKTKFKKGIPIDWEIEKLESVCSNIFSGGTPSTSIIEYWDGDYYWLSSGETRNKRIYNSEKTITELGVANSSTKLAQINDLVMACAGQGKTRGQLSLIMRNMYVNQSVIVIRPNDEFFVQYIFENLKSRYDELRAVSDASSTRGSITTELLKNTKILIPNKKLLIKFSNLISPILKELEVLEKSNQNLIKQRDLLLPRLMSGKLKV